MRVLMVNDVPIDGGYGTEVYVRRLTAGIRTLGDSVNVVDAPRRRTGMRRAFDLYDPGARRAVATAARECRADVIHFHNVLRELSPAVLSASPSLPAVMTIHDLRVVGAAEHQPLSPRHAAGLLTAGAARHAIRHLAITLVGVSDVVTDRLRGSGLAVRRTVPVPVDEPEPGRLRPVVDCRDLLVAARLSPDKGVDVVIRAWMQAMHRFPESVLHIAGDGPLRARLEALAGRLPPGRVAFHGHLATDDLSLLMGRCAGVVVASLPQKRPEGSSLAVVEAAAHGRPVIASDDPAIRELAAELGGVATVPAGDVDALSMAMITLLDDATAAAAAGDRNGGAVLRRHGTIAVASVMRGVYDEVVADRGGA